MLIFSISIIAPAFTGAAIYRRAPAYIPGAEASGTVVEVGPDVKDIKIGDRVAYGISNGYGSYAELYAVPSWHLFKLPNSRRFSNRLPQSVAAGNDRALFARTAPIL